MIATEAKKSNKSLVLITASLVSSLIMLDSNIVAVSLPAISRSLNASFTDVQWVISAYVLTYAALLLATGSLADLCGRKKAMIVGLAIFMFASAACGLAPSVLILDLARAVQGIGGAFLLTASLAVISHEFTGEERAGAFAFWGAALGIALAVGPVAGGAITQLFGWRWVFLVNLPLCVVLIIACLKILTESTDPNARGLDIPGIATFSCGLGVLIWALISGNDANWDASVMWRLGLAALLFGVFIWAENRSKGPMVDLQLFKGRTFLGATMAMLGYGACAQVMVFFLPIFLQDAYRLDSMKAGIAMLPFALPMVLAPRVVNHLPSGISGRSILVTGLLTTVVANVLFWYVAKAGLGYSIFVVAMLVAGCGAGLLNGQTVKVLTAAVPANRSGMASGLASTTRFIGILVSVAVLGAILSSSAIKTFEADAPSLGIGAEDTTALAKRVTSGDIASSLGSIPDASKEAVERAAAKAFSVGFGEASALAALLAAIFSALTFFMIEGQPRPARAPDQKLPCKFIDCRDPV